jgi:hypothetical protein
LTEHLIFFSSFNRYFRLTDNLFDNISWGNWFQLDFIRLIVIDRYCSNKRLNIRNGRDEQPQRKRDHLTERVCVYVTRLRMFAIKQIYICIRLHSFYNIAIACALIIIIVVSLYSRAYTSVQLFLLFFSTTHPAIRHNDDIRLVYVQHMHIYTQTNNHF